MGWYLYMGNRVKAIPTGLGNTVAVRPYERVEIHQMTATTQKMLSLGDLRVAGAPAQAVARPARVEGGRAVLRPTEFAGYFTDMGQVTSPAQLPVPVGAVEDAAKNVSDAEVGGSVGEAVPGEPGDAGRAEQPERHRGRGRR